MAGGGEEVGVKKTPNKEKRVSTKQKTNGASERPVLVTTEHRGVFFGYAAETRGTTIELKRARLCVYWSPAMHGFMGLASAGPDKACKVGPPADIELRAITSVVEVAPEAVERWEAAPWS
jgi:hypothetical protein